MNSSRKDVVRVILICFFVMVFLPLCYRVWTMCHPQQKPPRHSLSQRLDKAVEDNLLRYLRTPPAKWPKGARELEPRLFAWLAAHGDIVFPWEWTEEACRKDQDGYRKLWLVLFEEFETDLKGRLKTEQTRQQTFEREILRVGKIHDFRTNQLARIRSYVATNSFPMTISFTRLSESEYWGSVTKQDSYQVASREELHSESGWFLAEERLAEEEGVSIAVRTTAIHRSSTREDAVRKVLSRIEAAMNLASQTPPAPGESLMKELLYMIKFTED